MQEASRLHDREGLVTRVRLLERGNLQGEELISVADFVSVFRAGTAAPGVLADQASPFHPSIPSCLMCFMCCRVVPRPPSAASANGGRFSEPSRAEAGG